MRSTRFIDPFSFITLRITSKHPAGSVVWLPSRCKPQVCLFPSGPPQPELFAKTILIAAPSNRLIWEKASPKFFLQAPLFLANIYQIGKRQVDLNCTHHNGYMTLWFIIQSFQDG